VTIWEMMYEVQNNGFYEFLFDLKKEFIERQKEIIKTYQLLRLSCLF
jgi:hypothetical protein